MAGRLPEPSDPCRRDARWPRRPSPLPPGPLQGPGRALSGVSRRRPHRAFHRQRRLVTSRRPLHHREEFVARPGVPIRRSDGQRHQLSRGDPALLLADKAARGGRPLLSAVTAIHSAGQAEHVQLPRGRLHAGSLRALDRLPDGAGRAGRRDRAGRPADRTGCRYRRATQSVAGERVRCHQG